MRSPTGMQIYDTQGHRLYLTGSERAAFRTAAEAAPREVRTYCWTLLYTGCRPSEALALTADRVDFQAAVLTFESKKKRRSGLYRAVPVPASLLDALDLVHGLRDRATRTYLWTWSLKTAYTRVIEIMARAGIAGPQASPKGLRHGFGVACIQKGTTKQGARMPGSGQTISPKLRYSEERRPLAGLTSATCRCGLHLFFA